MFYGRGITQISSGNSSGRSVSDPLMKGRVTITGQDGRGVPYQRIVEIRDGEVWDNILKIHGKLVHRIAYGQFEKINSAKGRELIRFKKGTGKGKHGKAFRDEKLFGHDGRCHSWYKNGRLVRQKFVYANGRTAYDYNAFKGCCSIKDPAGNVLYGITGALAGGNKNAFYGCHSVFGPDSVKYETMRSMLGWFLPSKPFEVKNADGKVILAGQYEHNQKVGKWVEAGRTLYYVNGVAIPKKLYETPAEKLDPVAVLKIENAQLRMAMMDKISAEQIAKAGKVIHKEGDMRLYDIPKLDVRILRVRCTTTKVFYYLKVPRGARKCEEARQWTFGVGQDIEKPIKFAVET